MFLNLFFLLITFFLHEVEIVEAQSNVTGKLNKNYLGYFYSVALTKTVLVTKQINDFTGEEWPPGWTEKCLGCICEATSDCNQTIGCLGDYCGMFLVSHTYWVDAGAPVLIGDDSNKIEGNT